MSLAEKEMMDRHGLTAAFVKCFKHISDADCFVLQLSKDEFVVDAFVVKTFASGFWYVVVIPWSIEVHGA